METIKKDAEVLNDLIEINNDRVEGYTRAIAETATDDNDLRSLFTDMANESRGYADELRQHVTETGEDPTDGTTNKGKIYRMWMDVKAFITGHDRKAILASCEFGEDAAQKAYKTALEEEDLLAETRALITEQKSKLRASHDKIKRMRDSQ